MTPSDEMIEAAATPTQQQIENLQTGFGAVLTPKMAFELGMKTCARNLKAALALLPSLGTEFTEAADELYSAFCDRKNLGPLNERQATAMQEFADASNKYRASPGTERSKALEEAAKLVEGRTAELHSSDVMSHNLLTGTAQRIRALASNPGEAGKMESGQTDEQLNQLALLGKTKHWTKDGIIYAENDIARVAYAGTTDRKKIGTLGWHGPDQICVEYIDAKMAEAMIERIAKLGRC